jgi:YfiH family protein
MSTKVAAQSKSLFGFNVSDAVGDDPDNVRRCRNFFFEWMAVSGRSAAIPVQTHSCNILHVGAPGTYEDCDALITSETSLALAITVADCVPILLYAPGEHVIAAVHAGWRGSAAGIAGKTLDRLAGEFAIHAQNIFAFVGASASSCCYEVGEDVATKFENKSVSYKRGKPFVDLKQANAAQLLAHGVPSENIEISSYCTICERDLFHSFRRDGRQAGRMMASISMV